MTRKRRRISNETASVLNLFVQEPERPRFGLEIVDATQIPSGSLYPILVRLENEGILESAPEDLSEAAKSARHGGRRRRYYRVTSTGLGCAQQLLVEWSAAMSIRRAVPRLSPA